MYLGRVTGSVWATAKDPGLNSQKLLIVQPVTPDLNDAGKRLVCADCTGAGPGEIVYWLRGKEASFPFLPAEVPVDTAVVGIVDSIHYKPASPAPADAAKPARKR